MSFGRGRFSGVLEVKLSQPMPRQEQSFGIVLGHWLAILIPVWILWLISTLIAIYRLETSVDFVETLASFISVIPLFIEQIKANKEITITNPDMTRFMMNLDNAVDLVLHAFNNGSNGDIFIQKSPAATIKTLAQALIELYNSSSKIKYIGIRHGEKMYETLVTKEEMIKAGSD